MVYQYFKEYHINRRGNSEKQKKKKNDNYIQSFTTIDVQPLTRSSEIPLLG